MEPWEPKRGAPSKKTFAMMLSHISHRKYTDTPAASRDVVAGSGSITLLNGCAQGSDETQHIGNRVTVNSVQLRGVVNSSTTATGPAVTGYMIVYDKSNNKQTPQVTDILVTSHPFSFMNDTNKNRFQIMRRRLFTNAGQAGSSVGSPDTGHVVDDYVKVNRETVYCVPNDATAGSIQTGALWLITFGDQVAQSAPAMVLGARCRFTDSLA